jgi:hypothetical protein
MEVRFVDVSSSSPLLVLVNGGRYVEELKNKYNNRLTQNWLGLSGLGKITCIERPQSCNIYFCKSIDAETNQEEAYFYVVSLLSKGVYGKSWRIF